MGLEDDEEGKTILYLLPIDSPDAQASSALAYVGAYR
jgi:hypothetical protein